MLYRTDKDGNLIKVSGNSNLAYQGNSLPIGSIFTSALPQTSNKYHLLNGDCLEVNGIYSGFFNYLISLVSQGYSVTCAANEYAEDLYKVGSCGRFVLNNTNNEVVGSYTNEKGVVVEFTIPAYSFKLPSVSSVIQGVNSLEELGKAIEAGLPNITGNVVLIEPNSSWDSPYHNTGPFSTGTKWNRFSNSSSGPDAYGGSNFNASRSNPIYGKSNTVQPASVKYPYYIVLISGSALDIKANPELTGDEEVLNSINIGGVNYLLNNNSSNNIYSTEEQVVGKWIDGKPIYQITLELQSTSNDMTIDMASYNIEKITKFYGVSDYADSSIGINNPIPYTRLLSSGAIDSQINLFYRVHTSTLVVRPSDYAIFTKLYITLQYTKTTD